MRFCLSPRKRKQCIRESLGRSVQYKILSKTLNWKGLKTHTTVKFQQRNNEDQEFSLHLRMLCALAFLPLRDAPGFKANYDNDAEVLLSRYFHSNYGICSTDQMKNCQELIKVSKVDTCFQGNFTSCKTIYSSLTKRIQVWYKF